MKRVLISAIAAGALLGQLHAVEVYKDGDKSFGVFGTARAMLGYGWNFDSHSTPVSYSRNEQNDILYGIQGNSRIGINFTVGKVFGAALIGAGESTFRNGSGTAGFRQLYAGYDFGDAGKLLAGKNELITSMGGFSSDTWNTDSGLNGFGGTSTSTRRFQVAYSVAGVTASISENDVVDSGYEKPLKNWQKSIPRISVGYEYKDSSIRAKVAASYAYSNATGVTTNTITKVNDGGTTTPEQQVKTKATSHKNIALITAGVRPVFGEQYVSALLTYGLNANSVGETSIVGAGLQRGFGVTNTISASDLGLSFGSADVNTYAAMLEYGINLTDDFALKVGAGYQFTSAWMGSEYGKLHSYAAFVQLPYKVGAGFNIIPQVGYLGTTRKSDNTAGATYDNTGSVLATVQFALNF